MNNIWRGGPIPRRAWQPYEDTKLTRDWYRNIKTEIIAEELGRSISDVKRRRMKLGLPPRRYLKLRRKITTHVDVDLFHQFGRRCVERGQSISSYLRSLIVRDLGG